MTSLTLVEKFPHVQSANTLLTLLNEPRQASVQGSTDTNESPRSTAIATLRSTSVHDDAFTLLAHDLSNKLNVILGCVEFLEESLHLHGARYEEEMLTRLKSGIL